MRGRLVATCALAAATSAACAGLLGIDDLEGRTIVLTDGAVDASTTVAVDASGCALKHPPPRPTTAGGPNGPPLVLAMRSFDMLPDTQAREVGFDLDGVCTVATSSPICAGKLILDQPHGIDNAFVEAFLTYKALFPQIQDGVLTGTFGAVLKIDGYNGLGDDEDVDVSFWPVVGRDGGDDGGAEWVPKPTDQWFADGTVLADRCPETDGGSEGATVGAFSAKGYVSANTLVALFPQLQLTIWLNGHAPITVMNAVIAIENLRGDAPAGTIAGAWQSNDLLNALAHARLSPVGDEPLPPVCKEPEIWPTLRSEVCGARDIALTTSTGALPPCDAISVGAVFSAYRIERPPPSCRAETRYAVNGECDGIGLTCP